MKLGAQIPSPLGEVCFRRLTDAGEAHSDPAKAREKLFPDRPSMRAEQMARLLGELAGLGWVEIRGARALPAVAPDAWRGKPRSLQAATNDVPMPDGLATAEFAAEWARYLDYRRKVKRKAVNPTEARQILEALAKLGPAQGAKILETSRLRSYLGLALPEWTHGNRRFEARRGSGGAAGPDGAAGARRITGADTDQHDPRIV